MGEEGQRWPAIADAAEAASELDGWAYVLAAAG
jgi:hypothetical protein